MVDATDLNHKTEPFFGDEESEHSQIQKKKVPEPIILSQV